MNTTTVAVLGTGVMGHPIAARLAEQGHHVRAWNRTRERASFDDPTIEVFDTPQDAVAGATYVLTVLADDNALSDVFLSAQNPLHKGLSADQTVLNLGTVRPDTIERLAAQLSSSGVPLLDVGMLGNARHARSGELRLYVGGDSELAEHAAIVLDTIGKETRQVGPLGSGMKVKLALNLLMGLEMQALAEVARLADLFGLDRGLVLDVVSGSGFSAPVMTFKAKRMAARRYQAPDFRLALMTKDLGLADQLAMELGYALPMTGAAYDTHREACDAGLAELDCAAIAEAVSGAPVPPKALAG